MALESAGGADRQATLSFRFGAYEFNPESLELRRSGRRCALQPQPARALAYLVQRPGRLVSRDELALHLWPEGTFVDAESGLNVALRQIRRALRDDHRAPRFIETLPRRGYRFIAPVERSVDSPALSALGEVPGPGLASPAVEPARARSPRRSVGLVATVGAAVVAALAFASHTATPIGESALSGLPANRERPVEPRLAVALLALRDLSDRPEDAWLPTAVTEMLVSELGAGERLRSIPAQRVDTMQRELALEGRELETEDLARIREYLAADLVLTGSFATVDAPGGKRIRIDLRLRDTAQGLVLATAAGQGHEAELFELVASCGHQLRQQLGVGTLAAATFEATRAGLPTTAEGARQFSLGLEKLRRLDLQEACEQLDDAAALAPRAARVHAALARCWSDAGYDGRAEASALRAYELSAPLPREDRLLIEAHHLETKRDWSGARAIYEDLWAVFPDTVEHGMRLATMETSLGRPDRALELLDQIRVRLPAADDDPRLHLAEAECARARGDLVRQRTAAARAAEIGQRLGARALLAQARLAEAEALHHLGETERAATVAAEARDLLEEQGDRRLLAAALVHRLDTIDAEGVGLGLSYEEALGIFRSAGDRLGIARTLVKIARVETALGTGNAEVRLDEALALARELANFRVEAEALNTLAIVAHHRMHNRLAVERFEAAAKQARASGDMMLTAGILANLAGEMSATGDPLAAQGLADEAVAIARHVGSRFLFALTLIKSGDVALGLGQLDTAYQRMSEALDVARSIGDDRLQNIALGWQASIVVYRGELETGRALLARSIERWETHGSPGLADWSRLRLAEIQLEHGELEVAEGLLRTVVAHQAINGPVSTLATACLAEVLLVRGSVDQARELVDSLPADVEHKSQALLLIGRAVARVHAASGRRIEAIATAKRLVDDTRDKGSVGVHLEARLFLGRMLIDAGETAQGRAELARLAEDAAASGFHYAERLAREAAKELPSDDDQVAGGGDVEGRAVHAAE